MRFLHISDIHFDPKSDGEDTDQLRKKWNSILLVNPLW